MKMPGLSEKLVRFLMLGLYKTLFTDLFLLAMVHMGDNANYTIFSKKLHLKPEKAPNLWCHIMLCNFYDIGN